MTPHRSEGANELRAAQDLLNLASHGLATPLTPALVHFHLLRTGDPLTARQTRSLDVIERSFRKIQAQLADLRLAADLLARPPEARFRDFDLAGAIAEAVTAEDANAARGGVAVVVGAARSTVHADRDLLVDALRRLLQHATTATPAGGTVHVDTDESRASSLVRVHDGGGPITSDDSPNLFDVHAPDVPGRAPSGFDLFVASHLAAAAGGEIGHETARDGAVLTVRLKHAGR